MLVPQFVRLEPSCCPHPVEEGGDGDHRTNCERTNKAESCDDGDSSFARKQPRSSPLALPSPDRSSGQSSHPRLITYRLCSIARTALSPPAPVFIPEADEVALGKCPVHKSVLDHVDPEKNVGKDKRSYLASPLNVASFPFLKRGLRVPGLSGAATNQD